MEKRFIYFSTKAKFLGATQGTEYLFTSIVFIGDTKEIWNRGIFYGTPNDFDINDYLLKSDAASTYQPKGNYLTEHQDLSEYAKTSELQEAIKDFATKSYVDEAVEAVDVTDQLVDYAKSADVTKEIGEAVKDLAKKSEIPSIDGLATEDYVDEAIEGLSEVYQPVGNYLTEVPEGYATETYVDNKVKAGIDGLVDGASEAMDTLKEVEEALKTSKSTVDALNNAIGSKASKEELESAVEDMATMSWVEEQNYLKTHQSLDAYATKEYVAQEIAKVEIPSVEGLASEEYVDDVIEGLSEVYQPKGNYLTEHQSLAGYAKSADVTEEISEAVEGLSETYYSKSEVDAMFEWGEY